MKTDKRILYMIGIVYLALLLGGLAFYLINPFKNECIKGNCYNGYGMYRYNSGIQYEGEWKNGRRHRKGKLTYPDTYEYEGEWKNNRMDGYGTMVYNNWYTYTGEWRRGAKNGQGTMHFWGMVYKGRWKNNLMHGQGTLISPGGFELIGEWENNRIYDGVGTFIIGRAGGIRYEGQWEKGKFSGSVTIPHTDGSKFIGEVRNSEKYGQGTILYTDGRTLNSPWIDEIYLFNDLKQ